MTETGTIHQGAIVPDKPLGLAEGARVEFEVMGKQPNPTQPASLDATSLDDWAILRDVDSQQLAEIEAAILDRSESRLTDLAGAYRDDEDLEEICKEAYRKRDSEKSCDGC